MKKKIFVSLLIFPLLISLYLGFFASSSYAYTNNMSASIVLGQPNFTGATANNGGISASTLNAPRGIAICNGKLLVSDATNNRFLIWNTIPTSSGTPADVVIGQPNMISNTVNNGGISASTINGGGGLTCTNGKLIIGDSGNSRVLIFNQIPTTNGASADVVVGQPDFASNTPNNGGIGPSRLKNAIGVASDGTKLFILDDTNSRILIFNHIPTTNSASADVVVGQSDFVSAATGCTASRFGTDPFALYTNGTQLIVGDTFASPGGNRVLIWNNIPTVNGQAADVVVGQPNLTTCTVNTGGVGANTLSQPFGVFVDDKGRLFVADRSNGRILIYNSIPTTNNVSANYEIGQPNMVTSSNNNQGQASPGANTLRGARFITTYNNQLFVSDGDNNRVLIFEDVIKNSQISVNSTEPVDVGKLRFKGSANIDSLYNIKSIEYSVNGGNYIGLGPSDGSFDEASEDFSFDFDPKTNGNDKYPGYVLKIRSMNSNLDASEFTYFQPFEVNEPKNNLTTTNPSPTFSFSINRGKFEVLKSSLSEFRIMYREKGYKGSDWKTFVDIPVDFEKVKATDENIYKYVYWNRLTNGNGTYEDKDTKVVYSNYNSLITVTPKTNKLRKGTYEYKIISKSKSGITQETEPRTITVSTTGIYITKLSSPSPSPTFLTPTETKTEEVARQSLETPNIFQVIINFVSESLDKLVGLIKKQFP